jgi:hypothetical protein
MSPETAGSVHEVPATSQSVAHNREFLSSANSNSVSVHVFTSSGVFFYAMCHHSLPKLIYWCKNRLQVSISGLLQTQDVSCCYQPRLVQMHGLVVGGINYLFIAVDLPNTAGTKTHLADSYVSQLILHFTYVEISIIF